MARRIQKTGKVWKKEIKYKKEKEEEESWPRNLHRIVISGSHLAPGTSTWELEDDLHEKGTE